MSVVQPRFALLSAEQIAQANTVSLDILSTIGLRVDAPRARTLLLQAGCRPIKDERLAIPPELVAWALDVAPSQVTIGDRRGEIAFSLGGDNNQGTIFGIGVTNLYYQDPLTDQVSLFDRASLALSARLADSLESFDLVSTIGILRDVPAEVADLFETLELIANTTRPLVTLVSEEHNLPLVLDLCQHLVGDLEHPFVIPYLNPITPLVINQGTFEKMVVAIERNVPFIYSNYGMSGATTPITPAGTLALLNAELLAGLVLSQLVRQGAPVILGSLPAAFDMREMVSFYAPESFLLNLACAEMMDHYQLPHCGTSGSGNGWGPDLLASDALWLNHLSSCLGRVGLAPFVGGNLDSMAFSPAMVVHADWVIQQARRFSRGFEFDEQEVALKDMATVGPGGSFLIAPQTLKRFRTASMNNPIFPRLGLERWQELGCPRAGDTLRNYAARLLANAPPPPDRADLIARGEAFISRHASC